MSKLEDYGEILMEVDGRLTILTAPAHTLVRAAALDEIRAGRPHEAMYGHLLLITGVSETATYRLGRYLIHWDAYVADRIDAVRPSARVP